MNIHNFAIASALSLFAALPTKATAAGPDLVVSIDMQQLQVTTKNIGNFLAPASHTTITCQSYNSSGNSCAYMDFFYQCLPPGTLYPVHSSGPITIAVPALRPGRVHTAKFSCPPKNFLRPSGCAVYAAWADAFYQVAEAKESNNVHSVSYGCTLPSNISPKRY